VLARRGAARSRYRFACGFLPSLVLSQISFSDRASGGLEVCSGDPLRVARVACFHSGFLRRSSFSSIRSGASLHVDIARQGDRICPARFAAPISAARFHSRSAFSVLPMPIFFAPGAHGLRFVFQRRSIPAPIRCARPST
jgi:hypothetical protein